MADRFLAQFPISDNTGYSATEVVAAIEGGKPVTFERKRTFRDGNEVRLTDTFVWRNERVALSVAMAAAGWGHLNLRTQRMAQEDTDARIAAAAVEAAKDALPKIGDIVKGHFMGKSFFEGEVVDIDQPADDSTPNLLVDVNWGAGDLVRRGPISIPAPWLEIVRTAEEQAKRNEVQV